MSIITILDHTNSPKQVELNMGTLAAAKDSKAANVLRHLDNTNFTGKNPSASAQIYAAMGMGRSDVSVGDILTGKAADLTRFSAASTDDGGVTGRLVMSAYLMDTIENKLKASDYGMNAIFAKKAAVTDTITGTKFERPILNYSGPEKGRSQPIAQLSEPASMVLLTASDRSMKIAGSSIGIEYSDQAAEALSLPIVALSMSRQAEVEYTEAIEQKYRAFLNGDADLDMAALVGTKASTFDASIVANGVLTQKAWVKWLFRDSRKRRIDTICCTMNTALAIEARLGRPTVQGDNATSKRIDTLESIINPTWPTNVDVIIIQDPAFPDNTILGFDSRYGYHNVISTTLAYNAVEAYAIRRSTKVRVDYGNIAYRLFDDAWDVLTLTI